MRIGVADVIAVVLLAATMLFAYIPCGRALTILPLLLAAYIIPIIIYRHSSYYSTWGQIALSIAFAMMSIFFTLNLWQSTVLLGSVEAPFLLHDAYSFRRLAQDISHHTLGQFSPIVPYMGFPYYLSLWLDMGVIDIAYPIIVNLFLMQVVLLQVGQCVCYVVGKEKPYTTQMAGYAMLITALVPGVMANGTVLLKEPFVIVSLLLCINAMYAIKQRYRVPLHMIVLLLGMAVLSLSRPTYIYVLLVYMVVIWIYRFSHRDIWSFAVIVSMAIISLWIGVENSWWGSNEYISDYVAGGGHRSFSYGESQKPFLALVGHYASYPIWHKIAMLPFTAGVQFMIPFPFESVPEAFGMPMSGAYHRMSYLWYMAALPIFVFYVLHWWRKDVDRRISLMALASAVAYCVPAFVTGGVVSRYAFCFVPLMSVMGAYVMTRMATYKKSQRRVAVIFAIFYVLLLATALYVGAHPSLIV